MTTTQRVSQRGAVLSCEQMLMNSLPMVWRTLNNFFTKRSRKVDTESPGECTIAVGRSDLQPVF